MTFAVNGLPLIIGAVFNMVLGSLWYSKLLFGKPWMKETGISKEYVEESKAEMGRVYLFITLFAAITSYVIGLIITNFGVTSIMQAIIVAVLVWLGISFPKLIKDWGFEDRSLKLGLIDFGYDLVVYIVIAILFVLF